MGIKRLNKYLLETDNAIFRHNNLDSFCKFINKKNNNPINKTVILAVDTSLYLYKYMYSYPDFLIGFALQISRFLSYNILPLYVFEGTPPIEKNEVIKMRNDKKKKIKEKIDILEKELAEINNYNKKLQINKEIKRLNKQMIHVSKEDIENLKSLFDKFNIQYITAVGEADSMCSYLSQNNLIDACLSDDMDILVSGCSDMIKFTSGEIIHYNLEHILEELDISYNRFVQMCVVFGCDYVKPVPKLDNKLIYKFIKDGKDLQFIITYINQNYIKNKIEYLKTENPDLTDEVLDSHFRKIEDYNNAITLFMNSHKEETINDLITNQNLSCN